MKWIVRLLAVFVLVLVVFAAAVEWRFRSLAAAQYPRAVFTIRDEVAKADRELGRRIFEVRNGCVDCHGKNLGGQLVMDNGAMGSIWGANLTRLQDWSDEEIASAIRYGVHKSGRSLRFMPSFDFEGLSKGDVAALVAYIRSAPRVEGTDQENRFGPVARLLSALGKMPVMFPAVVVKHDRAFADKPSEAANAGFGEYLARSCKGCHGEEYRGGPIPGGDPSWPAAANVRLGADPVWTEEKFRAFLKTGVSPRTGQPSRAPMPVAALQQLNETEATALWQYLSSLK